jgi:hypothetical protein
MSDHDAVPEVDDEPEQDRIELPDAVAEPPGNEADLLEQAQVVREEQRLEPADRSDEVPEADWFEQRVSEDLDDEER